MQTSDRREISYFLGTGPLEYYYTLWSKIVIPGTGCFYSYRQNLAHDYDEAIAKATEKTGQSAWEKFDISEYRRTQHGAPDLLLSPDEITLTFGKYAGQTLGHVLDNDIGYVLFLALKSDWQPSNPRQARVMNYIRAMFKEQAQAVETERKERLVAERAARDAARADLPVFNGRVTIQGTVISIKGVDGSFGFTFKMLVEHETGWKVWGTIPAALNQLQLNQGDVVRFDAKIQKSDRDAKFGFFSRATKAVRISEAIS
jgi:hypothetical protein